MIDELAYAAGKDPVAFRREHITSDAWMSVLEAVAKASNWQPRPAASTLSNERHVTGRGVSIGGETHTNSDEYAGVVAEITVDRKTGRITVNHLYAAQEAGVVVNPASVENQIVGMLTQGVSRTLIEEMTFTKKRVTGLDWVTYPMLRFKDAPKVTTMVITRPNEIVEANLSPASIAGPRYRGAGEPTVAAVPAAIGNALLRCNWRAYAPDPAYAGKGAKRTCGRRPAVQGLVRLPPLLEIGPGNGPDLHHSFGTRTSARGPSSAERSNAATY